MRPDSKGVRAAEGGMNTKMIWTLCVYQATMMDLGQKVTAQSRCFLVESWPRGLQGFSVSTDPFQRSFPATRAWQQTFLPMRNVLPASLSHSVSPENSIRHPIAPHVFGFCCHESLVVEVGSDFTQTVAYSGVKFQVTKGCVFPGTSALPCSQQEWNCLTLPSPWGPHWKWDVSLMRTSQQVQLKYLCDCNSSVMNELIDFTLSCFFIDPAGPTVGKELCSSSSFPQNLVLLKGRWNGFRAEGGNPKTTAPDGSWMAQQAPCWVWMEGWGICTSQPSPGSPLQMENGFAKSDVLTVCPTPSAYCIDEVLRDMV